jgi:hypothetical protein
MYDVVIYLAVWKISMLPSATTSSEGNVILSSFGCADFILMCRNTDLEACWTYRFPGFSFVPGG